MIAINNIIYQ